MSDLDNSGREFYRGARMSNFYLDNDSNQNTSLISSIYRHHGVLEGGASMSKIYLDNKNNHSKS